MATLTLRSAKGSPLTHDEVDANFTNLNADIATLDSNKLSAESDTLATVTGRGATTTAKTTVGGLVINGEIEEQQYSLTGTDIDPANGTIQYKTLSANTTFTESLTDGEYVILMIDDGAGYTITWPTITWGGGSAPTLATSGYSVIVLWQVNTVVYGATIT